MHGRGVSISGRGAPQPTLPQQGKHAFTEPVGLFQVRVAGEDELGHVAVALREDPAGQDLDEGREGGCGLDCGLE